MAAASLTLALSSLLFLLTLCRSEHGARAQTLLFDENFHVDCEEDDGTTWAADLEPPLRPGETAEGRRAIDDVLAWHYGSARGSGGAYRSDGDGEGESGEGGRRSEYTYGEITPLGVRRLIQAMGLGADAADGSGDGDGVVVYDLGSGAGAFVAQVRLEGVVDSVVGIELSSTRHAIAVESWDAVRASLDLSDDDDEGDGGWGSGKVRFENRDVLEADFSDATHVYACSLCFPSHVIEALEMIIVEHSKRGRLRIVASMSDLRLLETGEEGRRWEKHEHDVKMTWGRSRIRVYSLIGSSSAGTVTSK